MRTYVTGGSGFVGTWLQRHLVDAGDDVVTADPSIDIADLAAVEAEVRGAAPEVVYHLAAQAHVGASWEDPTETFRVNVLGTLSLLEAVTRCGGSPTVLIVSSAEVYGNGDGSLFAEESPFRPLSPYAASKAAAELVGLQSHLGRATNVVRVRPFNHVGPGQSDSFVVSALARRIAEAERRGGGPVKVGNLSPSRDFTDVRDVVRAYRLLATSGVEGEVYNVCSGRAVTVEEVARRLSALATARIELVEDPGLYRPADVAVLLGDPARLAALTGWAPAISLDDTLSDVLAWWRAELSSSS